MIRTFRQFIVGLLIASFLAFPLTGINGEVQAQGWHLPELEPYLSADGLTLYNGVPPLIIKDDLNPEMQGIKAGGAVAADALADPQAAAATFSITYIAAGGTDPWGELCYDFPAEAKTAFGAAAAIWANTFQSAVPITIQACWADLGSSSGVLGYSGGGPLHRDFTGAPRANTWYDGSLANSLAGSDLSTSNYDMNITYNKYFSWYYGTDGNPGPTQHDLVSVAAHEMAHGLNFSGSVDYSGGTGSYGYGTGYPNIYDTFIEDGAGTALTAYSNPSTALGSLVTSGNLWFDGANANAGNGGSRVRIYAPGSWSGGSSYSHLDYSTFAGTINSLMVYAISAGSSNHNPGPVTIGLLKDLGWTEAGASVTPTPKTPAGTISDTTPTYKWTPVSGATNYRYELMKGATLVYTKTVPSSVCGATVCTSTPTTKLGPAAYKWRVQAMVGGVWGSYSAYKAFTISLTPKPLAPSSAITDTTPTYKWTRIAGASQYRYQLMKGTALVYTKTAPATACGASACSNTPTNTLTYGAYKWRVQALVGGVWRTYSAYKSFSVGSLKPRAGFWASTTGDEFYVTTSQTYVDNFAIYVTACGYNYKITHLPLVSIKSSSFAFTGPFYASGTFKSATLAAGKDGLSHFYLPYCGYVTGGPWTYTATWRSSAQPLPATVEPNSEIDRAMIVDQALEGYRVIRLGAVSP